VIVQVGVFEDLRIAEARAKCGVLMTSGLVPFLVKVLLRP
jgi:hypothetical protein